MQRSEANIKQNIAKNIAFYRKLNQDTQASLAEKLNYSDKSVSKWERGEGTPDIFVLASLAEIYGITVDNLISEKPVAPKVRHKMSHVLVTLMSAGLAWLAATLAFFVCKQFDQDWAWLFFIYGIPVSGIVLLVFTNMWYPRLFQCFAVSLIIWGLTLSLHLSFLSFGGVNIKIIYSVSAVLQVLAILWFVYLKNRAKAKLAERKLNEELAVRH